jgi:hypothetical protein
MSGRREPTFFADRDLGRRFPELLRSAGLNVERHDDHFAPDCPDEHWIRAIAALDWIALTRDGRIRYSPLALTALMENGARLFVLVGKLTTDEAAAVFLKWRNKIEKVLRNESMPFIAKIRRDGVVIWLRYDEWRKSRR